jgi:hypothetical protein
MPKSAAELIAQAKQLMEQAKKVEEANAIKIGKYVMSNIDKLTIEALREYVRSITNGDTAPGKVENKKTAKAK